MKNLVSIITVSALVTGCAIGGGGPFEPVAPEYTYDKGKSLALNVTDASGFKNLTDMPREDYEAFVEENPEFRDIDPRAIDQENSNLQGMSAAGGAVSGMLDPTKGLGQLGTAGMNVLMVMAPGKEAPSKKNWTIFWLPDGVSLDDYEAMYLKAMTKAFEGPDVEITIKRDKKFMLKNLQAGMGDCPLLEKDKFPNHCAHDITHAYYTHSPHESVTGNQDKVRFPKMSETPEFIESVDRARGPMLSNYFLDNPGTKVVENPDRYRIASKYMPEWAYLYVAKVENDYITPRIYHQGNAYYFIEP